MPLKLTSQNKKKPPPRPPPPNLNKLKSRSTHTINKTNNFNLIDWSPPNSPKSDSLPKFGGSVSSSFSSSTSSLASSKRSTEFDAPSTSFPSNLWGMNAVQNSNNSCSVQFNVKNNCTISNTEKSYENQSSSLFGPTIIRPRHKTKQKQDISSLSNSPPSLPMPTGPPPSPPKDVTDVITPYGIALYQFPATQSGDLGLEVDDVVILIRRVNEEWLYGQVNDQEGIFPQNFIQIINPLPEDSR